MDKNKINKVRDTTGAGVMESKDALTEMDWDVDAAIDLIETKRKERPDRPTGYAGIFQYNHNNRIAATLVLGCNTDFVGKTDEFKALGRELAQQVVGTNPRSIEELLEQNTITDPSVRVSDKVETLKRKTQESIQIIRFSREAV